MEEDEIVIEIDQDDMAEFIYGKLIEQGYTVPLKAIYLVLDAELDYMTKIGLLTED